MAQDTFYGGYTQSKWQSEQLITRQRLLESKQAYIYRLGLLTTDPHTELSPNNGPVSQSLGKSNRALNSNENSPFKSRDSANRDWFETQLINGADFSQLPPELTVDFTPTTFAARMIYTLSKQAEPGIYHIHQPTPVTAQALTHAMTTVQASLTTPKRTFSWTEHSTSPYRLFKMTGNKISSVKTAHTAQSLGLKYPAIDANYLKHYIESLWKLNTRQAQPEAWY